MNHVRISMTMPEAIDWVKQQHASEIKRTGRYRGHFLTAKELIGSSEQMVATPSLYALRDAGNSFEIGYNQQIHPHCIDHGLLDNILNDNWIKHYYTANKEAIPKTQFPSYLRQRELGSTIADVGVRMPQHASADWRLHAVWACNDCLAIEPVQSHPELIFQSEEPLVYLLPAPHMLENGIAVFNVDRIPLYFRNRWGFGEG